MEEKERKVTKIIRLINLRLARTNFWEFCKIKRPKFFTQDKHYLKEICDKLQALYESRIIRNAPDEQWRIITPEDLWSRREKEKLDSTGTPYEVCKKLIINTPPRFGKSSTLVLFSQWTLGKDQDLKIITVSYNEKLSGRFGRDVRNGIDETKATPEMIIYNDIFPATRIKWGDSSYLMWSLESKHFTYLATSFSATITGIGADMLLIDDPIRSHLEAFNADKLDAQYEYYTDTLMQRLEEGALQVIDMTRWSKRDLCGRLEPDGDWYVIKFEAIKDGIMLCDKVLSRKTYDDRKSKMSNVIFQAIYHSRPIDLEGTVYRYFKHYEIQHNFKEDTEYILLNSYVGHQVIELKRIKVKFTDENGKTKTRTKFDLFDDIMSYTETADEGDDYLCSIVYGTLKGQGYLLAVIHTQEPVEVTEPKTAWMFNEFKCRYAKIESNKGGKYFSLAVRAKLWEEYQSRECTIEWFHQAQNKMARILTNANWIMQNIYFPLDWNKRWPEFYDSITTFQKEGENQHDDAEDALTGCAEMLRNNQPITEEESEDLETYTQELFNKFL